MLSRIKKLTYHLGLGILLMSSLSLVMACEGDHASTETSSSGETSAALHADMLSQTLSAPLERDAAANSDELQMELRQLEEVDEVDYQE